MRLIGTLLLATTALLTGGGALYVLTGLIVTPLERFDGIASLLPLMAVSIGNALFICLLCVARLIRRDKANTPRTPNTPRTHGPFQTQTVTLLLGLIALTLGLPSLIYLAEALSTPDPGLRLIILSLSTPGLAIATLCFWRIAALRRPVS